MEPDHEGAEGRKVMILVDWPMPDSCNSCPFITPNIKCVFTGAAWNWGLKRRLRTCPLKEVHPETVMERVNHTAWKGKTVYVE